MRRHMKIPGTTNRHRIMVYAVAAVLAVAAAASMYEIRSDRFGPLAKSYLEELVDRRIEVGAASFTVWGRVTLKDVRIYNPPGYASPILAEIPRVYFYLGMTGGETSAFRPTQISLDDPHFIFERPDSESWNTERLWKRQAPRHDHPTFTLPIEINNAVVDYRDSLVGHRGFATTLTDVDANFTVMSDGTEISNFLQADGVDLEGGGTLALTIQSHPNARRTSVMIKMDNADVLLIKPYYDFLTLLDIRSGRGSGTYRLAFSGDTWTSQAEIALRDAEIYHAGSNTTFQNASPTISFRTQSDSQYVRIEDLKVQWYRATISGKGYVPARQAIRRAMDLELQTTHARVEDMSFLLCDPSLKATGILSGRCRLWAPPDGASRYEIHIDLDKADVHYAEVLTKAPGIRGRLDLTGASGQKPEKIALQVAQTTAILSPRSGGWNLSLASARGEDLRTHLVTLARQPRLQLTGYVGAQLLLSSGGGVKGTIDLGAAMATMGGAAIKPLGFPASISIDAHLRAGGWQVTDADIAVGQSRLHASGTWSGDNSRWTANIASLFESDLFTVLPRPAAANTTERSDETIRWTGPLSGRINWERNGGEQGRLEPANISASIDLTNADLSITGVGRKPAGTAGELRLTGAVTGGALQITDGRLRLQSTSLGVTGELSSRGTTLTLKGAGTGLDGLKNFLAAAFWGGLKDVNSVGNGDVEIAIESRGDETRIRADLVATWASLSYADTWQKPAGQSFRVHTIIVQQPTQTRVERFEIVQGGSAILCVGAIAAGHPATLDATVSAQINVPEFLRTAPGLARITVDGRKASEALEMISDGDDRATLNWRASGTLDKPRLELAMKEIMGRVVLNTIARQVRRVASILTAPVQIGVNFLRGQISKDTAAMPPVGGRN